MLGYQLPLRHRLVNLLLLTCFLAFVAETPVADVHDGDASSSELAHADQVPGHSHAGPVHQSGDQGSSSHGFHVCHCSHSHLSCLAAPQADGSEVALTLSTLAGPSYSLPEVLTAVSLRPPIA